MEEKQKFHTEKKNKGNIELFHSINTLNRIIVLDLFYHFLQKIAKITSNSEVYEREEG